MPTYKVGPATVIASRPAQVIRPLICEQCLEALGNVRAIAEYAKVSAAIAAANWPELSDQIQRHEATCPALKGP
jgi:hypothetical protein